MTSHDVTAKIKLTELEEVPEQLHRIYGTAVPAPVPELVLALVYGHVGAVADALHDLDVPAADLFLSLHETHEAFAHFRNLYGGNAAHFRQRSESTGDVLRVPLFKKIL